MVGKTLIAYTTKSGATEKTAQKITEHFMGAGALRKVYCLTDA